MDRIRATQSCNYRQSSNSLQCTFYTCNSKFAINSKYHGRKIPDWIYQNCIRKHFVRWIIKKVELLCFFLVLPKSTLIGLQFCQRFIILQTCKFRLNSQSLLTKMKTQSLPMKNRGHQTSNLFSIIWGLFNFLVSSDTSNFSSTENNKFFSVDSREY